MAVLSAKRGGVAIEVSLEDHPERHTATSVFYVDGVMVGANSVDISVGAEQRWLSDLSFLKQAGFTDVVKP